uniref:Dynein light chain n=1 Tax=Nothoprocta perdicaria TaxID=30464 RepID=A0A8C6Z8R5_NOTPE
VVLTRLKEKNSDLAEVEVDEVLCLMGHVASEVPSHDAVDFMNIMLQTSIYLLYVSCDVLLDVVLLEGLRGTLHSILLHLLRHVRILDDSLSVTHGCLHSAKTSEICWGPCQS